VALDNPARDAHRMVELLGRHGFEVYGRLRSFQFATRNPTTSTNCNTTDYFIHETNNTPAAQQT
jgi:hypothetical protein